MALLNAGVAKTPSATGAARRSAQYGGMTSRLKSVMRQRRWWPPDASFVLVIALSIVLGVWPLADPQWSEKGAYLLTVIAMLIIGSLISARDRWNLERRYVAGFGAQLIEVRAKVFTTEKHLADIANDYADALASGSKLPDINAAYFNLSDELSGVLGALVHLEIIISDRLMAVMDKDEKSIDDLRIILEELIAMNSRLSALYSKTRLGD
jgi:hypothetical protein